MGKDKIIERFVRDRDKAFTAAVMNDDWQAFKMYCKKYEIPIPKSKKAMKGGVYKAVQQCTRIPQEVKDVAFMKCLELGMSPYIKWEVDDDESGEVDV